jgi:transposase-like protein
MEPTNQGEVPKLSQVIQIDEGKIQEHLGEVVRSTVEEALNAMLDAEADRLCRAERYERTEARKDTRAGSYQRHLQDKCLGLVESLGEFYPEAQWQRCAVHFYRNVWTAVPTSKVKEVAAMLKAIHAQEDRAAARQKAEQVAAKLKEMKLADAAALVVAGIEETLYYYAFPREHWRSLRTNNPLERLLREVRRRTRAVGAFPDGKSAPMLAAARLRHVAGTKWGTRRYLDMNRLAEASEAA